MRIRLSAITCCVLLFASTAVVSAQEAAPKETEQRNWTPDILASVDAFRVYADDRELEPLQVVQAYQWANPARPKVRGERLCLLYIHQGRPVASRKIYPTGRSMVHAFISMTDQPIICRAVPDEDADKSERGNVVWSPSPAGVEFKPVSEAQPPRTTASTRRIQMKSIAREFTAETSQVEVDRQKATPMLRLLPTPLYRYEIEDDGKDGLVDGATFCFVVGGGNPQAMLLIEAVREKGKLRWQYGFSRRTDAKLKAFHRGLEVWQTTHVPRGQMISNSPFFKTTSPVQ
ncbi:MAG: hypothetical protein AB8B91_07230 [Rubripirellula sp.]